MSIILEELEKRVKEEEQKKLQDPNYLEPFVFFDSRYAGFEKAFTFTDLYNCVNGVSKTLKHLENKTVFFVGNNSIISIVYLLALLKINSKIILIKDETEFYWKKTNSMPYIICSTDDEIGLNIKNKYQKFDESKLGNVNLGTSGTLSGLPKIVDIHFEENIRKLIRERTCDAHKVRGVYSSIATISGLTQSLVYPIIYYDFCYLSEYDFQLLEKDWIDSFVLSAEYPLSKDCSSRYCISNKTIYFAGSVLSFYDYNKVKNCCRENVELFNLFGCTEGFGTVSSFNIANSPDFSFDVFELMRGRVVETNDVNSKIKLIPISENINSRIKGSKNFVTPIMVDGIESDSIGFEYNGYIYCVGRISDINKIDGLNISLLKQYLKNEINEDFALYYVEDNNDENYHINIFYSSYEDCPFDVIQKKVEILMKKFNIPYNLSPKEIKFDGYLKKVSFNNSIRNLKYEYQTKLMDYMKNKNNYVPYENSYCLDIICIELEGKVIPVSAGDHYLWYGIENKKTSSESILKIQITLEEYITYDELSKIIIGILGKSYDSADSLLKEIEKVSWYNISREKVYKNDPFYHFNNLYIVNGCFLEKSTYNDFNIDFFNKKEKNIIIKKRSSNFGIMANGPLFDFVVDKDLIFFFTDDFIQKTVELSKYKKNAYVYIDEFILLRNNKTEVKFFLNVLNYIYNVLNKYFDEVNFGIFSDKIYEISDFKIIEGTLLSEFIKNVDSVIYVDSVEKDMNNPKLLRLGGKTI